MSRRKGVHDPLRRMSRRRAVRYPSRRVVDRDWAWGDNFAVTLSCGHVVYVRAYGRYAYSKTMGCAQCAKEAEDKNDEPS